MAEVTYTSKDGRFSTKIVAETEVGIVEQLVDFQSLMERNNVCAVCNNDDTFWNIRVVDDGSRYFEKKCYKCGASFPYHVNKDKVKKGGLYSSWKDKWEKYVPKPKDDSESAKVNGKSGKKG